MKLKVKVCFSTLFAKRTTVLVPIIPRSTCDESLVRIWDDQIMFETWFPFISRPFKLQEKSHQITFNFANIYFNSTCALPLSLEKVNATNWHISVSLISVSSLIFKTCLHGGIADEIRVDSPISLVMGCSLLIHRPIWELVVAINLEPANSIGSDLPSIYDLWSLLWVELFVASVSSCQPLFDINNGWHRVNI